MQLRVGTSGFSFPEWRGHFYPEKLPAAQMLSFYADRLPTVEINNTFYNMPKEPMLAGWAQKVPDSFSFALKAARRITHIGKLKGTAASVESFVRVASVLGTKLGPLLFQLPPTLPRDDALLAEFLGTIPKNARVALEFRHASWFHDTVYTLLSGHGAALCAAEVDPGEGTGSPYVRTAPFGYVRLRRAIYDEASLSAAFERIQSLGVEDAFVYLKHEVLGPTYAASLVNFAGSRRAPKPQRAPRKKAR